MLKYNYNFFNGHKIMALLYRIKSFSHVIVPDLGSRDCDVVLVGRTINSGKPWGVGNLEWGGDGEGEVSLRATWGQGGRDRITPKEGFQVSKRKKEGGNYKEPARGVKGGIAP
jgi:hypothetical protein